MIPYGYLNAKNIEFLKSLQYPLVCTIPWTRMQLPPKIYNQQIWS